MVNQKGVVLIMAMICIVVFSVLGSSFFINVFNEDRLVKRYEKTTRAFWLAEAGVAAAINNLPNSYITNTLGSTDNNYTAITSVMNNPEYYRIESTGSVISPTEGAISRRIIALVRTDPVDPANFRHAIRTTSNLVVKGSVEIIGESEEFASLNFADLFEHSKEELKNYAKYLYTNPPVDVAPVDTITWIELSPGRELRISSSGWNGSGILIVNGDAQITGGRFTGIIYVIGKLRMSGNPVIEGTILVESKAEIDTTLTGNVTIRYNAGAITDALGALQFISPVLVSWRED